MENKTHLQTTRRPHYLRWLALFVCCALFASATNAQQTSGGTQINNQAAATYSDGAGNNFSTVSNTVTVTVANVAGLSITPDAGTRTSVVNGQQNALYTFRVTNTGNFQNQVRFLANGQSIQLTGSATIAAAVIDVDASGTITAGDTNIFTNAADVISANIAQNGFVDVIVSVNIDNAATPGSAITVTLGDSATGGPTFDNQAANTSAHEVRTVATSVNGLREARGDVTATVDQDAQLRLNLTAPTGPLALGSTINYSWEGCNTGTRPAQAITLSNAPSGSNTGVFIIAPIPVGTALASGQTFPAGTLYSTTSLATTPITAVYTTTAPADLTTVRRVAFRVGATLTNGTCATAIPMAVTVTTTDATQNIFEIGDIFANNAIGAQITDQSGDTVSGAGDGNANFNEGSQPGNVDGNGIQLQTSLQRNGAGLIGPSGSAAAVGPNSNNDDYTNRSVTTGIAGLGFGSSTNAAGTVVFTNTISNTGNANDTYTVNITSAPAGFTLELSTNGGTSYTTVTAGNGSVSVPVAVGATANVLVRVTAPAGTPVLQEAGFPVVVRSTSANTTTSFNETIDRLYTGFIRMDKTSTVINNTGNGAATDAVPGAEIEYSITYRNIATTGGTGNSSLTASNLVITEDGTVAPNNWGATTTHVSTPASSAPSDSRSGTIVLSNGDTKLVDTVPSIAPQTSGVFKFRRLIK